MLDTAASRWAIASAAALTTVTAVMPTTMTAAAIESATTIATTSAVARTTVAAVTGHGLALTAHEGDADHREENRDA
jgi:hypothetical protein